MDLYLGWESDSSNSQGGRLLMVLISSTLSNMYGRDDPFNVTEIQPDML
jgi:hypothetical protein